MRGCCILRALRLSRWDQNHDQQCRIQFGAVPVRHLIFQSKSVFMRPLHHNEPWSEVSRACSSGIVSRYPDLIVSMDPLPLLFSIIHEKVGVLLRWTGTLRCAVLSVTIPVGLSGPGLHK